MPDPDKLTILSVWDDDAPPGPRRTLRPVATGEAASAPALPKLDPRTLELGGTIGEGGMAVVRLAVQRTLGREVAIKMLRPGQDTPEARRKVLHEAFVTGTLEHPNVVPVYEVGEDDAGRPYLVLRRIEGVPWSALIGRDDDVRARTGAADPVEWHLRVLLQVCNAVSFAHARGVLHRDLKPENVMIGGFGEVYLLDWGIAVAMDDAPLERIPRARDQTAPAGTPAYLAPEQLRDPGAPPLDERTDVYLLGAILYEVLHGRPPHHVEGLTGEAAVRALLEQVRREDPAIDPGLPEDVRTLLGAALARDPGRRPATAEAFRGALQGCLDQRGVQGLLARAEADLETFLARLSSGDGATGDILQGLGACRFGFQRVLEAWPGHERARAGLDRALEAAARWHLGHGDWAAADLLLAETERADPGLRAEVEAARTAARARDERVRQLDDRTTGARARRIVIGVIGFVWVIGPYVGWFAEADGVPGYPVLTGVAVGLLALSFGLNLVARAALAATEFNRQIRWVIVFAPIVQLVAVAGAWLLGVPDTAAHAMTVLPWFGMLAALTAIAQPSMAPAAVAYGAAFLVSCAWPSWGLPAVSVGSFLLVANTMRVGFRQG